MRHFRLVIVTTLAFIAGGNCLAAGKAKSQAPAKAAETAPAVAAPAVHSMTPGAALRFDGFEVTLNKVVQPGAEALGGDGFTEYNLTVANTSADKELVLSNVALLVRGDARSMVKDPDDIVNQGDSGTKNAAASAGGAAVGAVGGMFGIAGSLVSMFAVTTAANKVFVDDPQKWREELRKRGFRGDQGNASIFPSETVTGSIWVKQAASEVAERMHLYVKQGSASRVVRLDLVGMPAAIVTASQ